MINRFYTKQVESICEYAEFMNAAFFLNSDTALRDRDVMPKRTNIKSNSELYCRILIDLESHCRWYQSSNDIIIKYQLFGLSLFK